MKPIVTVLEVCGGIVVGLLTVVSILFGFLIGLTEIPHYMRTLH